MAALGVEELAKKQAEASDRYLAIAEIERLKRADQMNAKLIDILDDVHCRITEHALIYKEGPFGGCKFFADIGSAIKEAKAARIESPDNAPD